MSWIIIFLPEEFKKFWSKFQKVLKYKDIDFIEFIKQKEILFIKDEIKKVKNEKFDYSRLIKYYKRKLVDYGAMKEICGYKTYSNCTREKKNEKIGVYSV